jgi:hypothetical protein
MRGRMRPPNTMAGSVCLWLSSLLSGVGAYFDFMEASKRLSRTGTAHMKRTSGIRGLEWEVCVTCYSGFLLQGVHRFESL